MRFMEWSKSNFSVRFAALALVGAFVASLGVVALPSEAEAQRGKRWVYAAKFKCVAGIGSVFTIVGPDTFLAVQTIVNVYNPTENSISFRKHYVIAAPQNNEVSSEKTNKETESVGPGLGHAINCFDIVDELVGEVSTITSYIGDQFSQTIEGWVIIEAPKEGEAKSKPILSVCANYQHVLFNAATAGGMGISLDVECYEGKKVKPKF